MRMRGIGLLVALGLLAAACTSDDSGAGAESDGDGTTTTVAGTAEDPFADNPTVDLDADTEPADHEVSTGVEMATVTGAEPGQALTLVDEEGHKILTLLADDAGQAHFAYVPDDHIEFETGTGAPLPTAQGQTLDPGRYAIWDETTDPPTATELFEVPAVDEVPDETLYEGQDLTADCPDLEQERSCYTYIEMRDGVRLSANVTLPDPSLWGEGPYPTVIEYSGYAPSKPGELDLNAGAVAQLLGYAVVGVNMRGTGCSGGVFDTFNRAQHADGYDAVETVARQPFVLNQKVGMVGLSYPGISQLYVASTRPPSLAAVAPQSVIDDPWLLQWPGGIYNDGFTREWLAERDRQSSAEGSTWVAERVDGGDDICAGNVQLRSQNADFEKFARQLDMRPEDADDRRLAYLVEDIDVPVFLTGAWQDEQTGPKFATMLDRFDEAPVTRFTLYNGRHPDGLGPLVLTRWYEFLELYVAERVPELPPAVRALAPELLADAFGARLELEEDRFADAGSYEEAREAYEAEPPVRVLFEVGAGGEVPGAPVDVFEASFDSWPPSDAETVRWYLGPDGSLGDEVPDDSGFETYRHDPDAGSRTYTDTDAYAFIQPTIEFEWAPLEEGLGLSYESDPLEEDTVLAGPGHLTLWFASEAEDANVEVNLTEVRPDGKEFRIQSGWLDLGHRNGRVDDLTDELRVEPSYLEEDFEPLPPGELVEAQVPIMPFAHPLRAGSRLRLTIDTPGRDLPLWTFANPEYDEEVDHEVAWGPEQPSELVLMVLPGIEVAGDAPPCPSLRGQVCRDHVAIENQPAD